MHLCTYQLLPSLSLLLYPPLFSLRSIKQLVRSPETTQLIPHYRRTKTRDSPHFPSLACFLAAQPPPDIFKHPSVHNPFASFSYDGGGVGMPDRFIWGMPSLCVRKRGVCAGTIAKRDGDVKNAHRTADDSVLQVIKGRYAQWNESGCFSVWR